MGKALRRLWYLLRRQRMEADLEEEMAFHRAETARHLESEGITAGDAQLAASRVFGSGALARNRARDVWIRPWLQDLGQDTRFACRILRKELAFTAAVVLVLGAGIGVNTTQFTIVDAMCIRGLPIARADRVVYIRTRDAHDREHPLSYGDFEDLHGDARGLAGAAAFTAAPTVIAGDTQAPDRVIGVRISANGFCLLGVRPMLGRDFIPHDDTAGAPPVAVISYCLPVLCVLRGGLSNDQMKQFHD